MQSNLLAGDPLSLDRIRSVLTRLEDTIIFSLIERAQFVHNPRMYQRGAFEELKKLGFEGSWLEWFLAETETFHGALPSLLYSYHVVNATFLAKARRYTRYIRLTRVYLLFSDSNSSIVQMNIPSRQIFLDLFWPLLNFLRYCTKTMSTPIPPSCPSTSVTLFPA